MCVYYDAAATAATAAAAAAVAAGYAMWTGSLGRLSLARRPYPRRTAGRDDNAGQDIATTAWTTVTLPLFALTAIRPTQRCAVSTNDRR